MECIHQSTIILFSWKEVGGTNSENAFFFFDQLKFKIFFTLLLVTKNIFIILQFVNYL